MALQRKHFAKGYIVNAGDHYIRVEESYNGQKIEIAVGNEDYSCGCEPCDECGTCEAVSDFRISLSREQVKELLFVIKQLHFIDKE